MNFSFRSKSIQKHSKLFENEFSYFSLKETGTDSRSQLVKFRVKKISPERRFTPPPWTYREFEIHRVTSSSREEPSVHRIDVDVLDDGVRVPVKVTSALSLPLPLLSPLSSPHPREREANNPTRHHLQPPPPTTTTITTLLRRGPSRFSGTAALPFTALLFLSTPSLASSSVAPRPTSSRGIRVAINLPWRARCQNAERRGLPAGPRAGGGGGGTGADRMGREGKTRELQEL